MVHRNLNPQSFFKASGFPCLVCGIDSGPIRLFLVLTIGSFVLASVSFCLWALATGRLSNQKELEHRALEAEDPQEGN